MFWSVLGKINQSVFLRESKAAATAPSEHEKALIEVCKLSPEEALLRQDSSQRGLTAAQVEGRLETFGDNAMGRKKQAGVLWELARRCRNPLVIQLIIIAVVSFFIGEENTTYIVGVMIFLSVVLAYVQEHRSSKAVEKLQALVHTNCTVLRDGAEVEVPMADIVPGDVVVLQAGAIIPADLRLLSTKDFFVSQSSLTGESMPVEKMSGPSDVAGRGVIELANACFQGSNVVSGTARGLVVNTGVRTHFGAIAEKLAGQRVQTSFDKGIAGFTWLMIRFMVIMVALVFVVRAVRTGEMLPAIAFSLAVAVGLTPEMLPMIVTVNLAKGAMAMSRKKVIVKRLNSIQNFGAIDILCTDKTGTLTQDRVILEKHVDVTNRESDDVLRYAYMNSYFQTGLRNLLDRSILSHRELDVERNCRKVDEIPFDFQRKRMSVVVDYEGDHVLICKGAVEDIYKICTHYQIDDEIHLMIDMIKNDLLEEYEELSRDGYRVLAIAYREFSQDKQTFSVQDETDMVLLGYIAFLDPPKDSAAKAIASLSKAGVVTKILTGDNVLVTRKICREVGLNADTVVTGDQLLGLNEEQLGELAEKQNIFARLSPSQKEKVILALQKRQHVVGYMGDGINDAPSLRVADVGISVDTAVDVAKESADIVLLEKSLLVLEDGIMEGRRVFGNIIKYIRMGASSNYGNMFSVVGASFWLPFEPMAPTQLLLNNLLYDFSQTGIPTDRVDDEYLATPRRWNIANIRRFMLYVGPTSSIFDYATFFLMMYFFNCKLFDTNIAPGTPMPEGFSDWFYYQFGKLPEAADYLATVTGKLADSHPGLTYAAVYCEHLFHTGWFVESIITQTLIVHVIRTRRIPFIQSMASPALLVTTLVVIGIGCAIPHIPWTARFFGFAPLPTIYWAWIIAFVLAYIILTHNVKNWFFKKHGVD